MATFITADTHFDHNNILEYEDRPFDDLEHMEGEIIRQWNDRVMKNDTVYHLGDFSFGSPDQWRVILNELKGNIILIKGNHDKDKTARKMLSEGFLAEYHQIGTIIKANKVTYNLTHYPLDIGNRMNNINLHGHIHSLNTGKLCNLNVGVDSTFAVEQKTEYGPIPFENVMDHYEDTIKPLMKEAFANRNKHGFM